MKNNIEDLNERLSRIITGTCNCIGCEDCDLKWYENAKEMCSAIELQNKILDLEFKDLK